MQCPHTQATYECVIRPKDRINVFFYHRVLSDVKLRFSLEFKALAKHTTQKPFKSKPLAIRQDSYLAKLVVSLPNTKLFTVSQLHRPIDCRVNAPELICTGRVACLQSRPY